MGTDGKPLAALPNVGLASLAGGRVIYPHATPEYFAEFAAHARDLGAKVIGGCCGTTPAEIAAIRAAVEEERAPRAPLVFETRELVVALGEEQRETGLSRALARGRVGRVRAARSAARRKQRRAPRGRAALAESGQVGWVDINDNATARAGMSSLMVSARDRARGGHRDDPAPHDARLVGDRARVDAARRARRGRPEHARDYGRPARGRRLPGLARRVRDRLDRADAADDAASTAARTSTADRSTRRRRSSPASPSTRRPTTSRSSWSASSRSSRPARSSR